MNIQIKSILRAEIERLVRMNDKQEQSPFPFSQILENDKVLVDLIGAYNQDE